jgi:RHS repeat-associated protein
VIAVHRAGPAAVGRLLSHLAFVAGVLLAASPAVSQSLPSGNPATPEQVRFYHPDALGSVRAVTNNDGQIVSRSDYLPFGEQIPAERGRGDIAGYSDEAGNKQKFTGKERDGETGLDYFGARYLSGAQGRFTSVDPALDIADAIRDPQLWNRYAYVTNGPFRYTDPDGRERAGQLLDRDIRDLADGRIDRSEYLDRLNARGAGALAGASLVSGGWIALNARALWTAATVALMQNPQLPAEVAEAVLGPPGPGPGLRISSGTTKSQDEIESALRMAKQTGLRFVESKHVGADFIDIATNQAYDVMGGPSGPRAGLPKFLASLKRHYNKPDNITYVDLAGFPKAAADAVKAHIAQLPKKVQERIIIGEFE